MIYMQSNDSNNICEYEGFMKVVYPLTCELQNRIHNVTGEKNSWPIELERAASQTV